MSILDKIKRKEKRKTEPEGIYALIVHTDPAKSLGGTDREIVVIRDGRQILVYPELKCYRKILEDKGVPVIDTTKSDLPLEEWQKDLRSSIDLGKVKFY